MTKNFCSLYVLNKFGTTQEKKKDLKTFPTRLKMGKFLLNTLSGCLLSGVCFLEISQTSSQDHCTRVQVQ